MNLARLVTLSAILAPAFSVAAEFTRAGLFERPPFTTKSGGHDASAAGYELHGFFGDGENLEVSIFKTDTRVSKWVAADGNDSWKIEEADPENGTVTLLADGLRLRLRLAKEAGTRVNASAGPDGEPIGNRPNQAVAVAVAESADTRVNREKERRLDALRSEHPEYFEDPNGMSPEQRRISGNALREVDRQVMMFRATLRAD